MHILTTHSETALLFLFFLGYTVIGFAMYYFTYDPWIGKLLYLEDFYVMTEYRGKTFATFIFVTFKCVKNI